MGPPATGNRCPHDALIQAQMKVGRQPNSDVSTVDLRNERSEEYYLYLTNLGKDETNVHRGRQPPTDDVVIRNELSITLRKLIRNAPRVWERRSPLLQPSSLPEWLL